MRSSSAGCSQMTKGTGSSVSFFVLGAALLVMLAPRPSLAAGNRGNDELCRRHARSQEAALTAVRARALSIDQCALNKYWDRYTCDAVHRDYRRLVAELTKSERFCVADGEGAWVVEIKNDGGASAKPFNVEWGVFRLTNAGGRVEVPSVPEAWGTGNSRAIEERLGTAYFARWVGSMPRLVAFRWSAGPLTDVAVLVDRVSATDSVLDEEANERQWPARLTVGRAWQFEESTVRPFPEFDDGTISDVRRDGNTWALVWRVGLVRIRESDDGATGWYPLLGPEFTLVRANGKVSIDTRPESVRRLRNSCRVLRSSCGLAHPDASAFGTEVCRRVGADEAPRARSLCAGGTLDRELLESSLKRLRGVGVRVREP